LHRSLCAFSLAINGHRGNLGASLSCECGLSLGLQLASIYSRYLYRLSTVFPSVVFHSASRAFVVSFQFIENLLIDALVGLCPHRVFNLPRWYHRPLFLHPSWPSLLFRVVRLFLCRVVIFDTLCGNSWFRILAFPFVPSCRPGGTAPG